MTPTIAECESCAGTRRVCDLCCQPANLCGCEPRAHLPCPDCQPKSLKPWPDGMAVMVCPVHPSNEIHPTKNLGSCRDCRSTVLVDPSEEIRQANLPSNVNRLVAYMCEECSRNYVPRRE